MTMTIENKRIKKIAYNRPEAGDPSKDRGYEQRRRWSDRLRGIVHRHLEPVEIALEEHQAKNPEGATEWNQREWLTIPLRAEQVAVVDVMRKRHLANIGKEISRADTVAAFMAAGLVDLIKQLEFDDPRKNAATQPAPTEPTINPDA